MDFKQTSGMAFTVPQNVITQPCWLEASGQQVVAG
jgi:hypothetical protein